MRLDQINLSTWAELSHKGDSATDDAIVDRLAEVLAEELETMAGRVIARMLETFPVELAEAGLYLTADGTTLAESPSSLAGRVAAIVRGRPDLFPPDVLAELASAQPRLDQRPASGRRRCIACGSDTTHRDECEYVGPVEQYTGRFASLSERGGK